MKKILSIAIIGITLLTSASSTFASNHVSDMATAKGGQKIAECAQKMDKGISECVEIPECNHANNM